VAETHRLNGRRIFAQPVKTESIDFSANFGQSRNNDTKEAEGGLAQGGGMAICRRKRVMLGGAILLRS
jgi:hypothetical protein